MNLTITANKVREAAAQCPDAGRVLKTLFPEVFADFTPKHGTVTRWRGSEVTYLYLDQEKVEKMIASAKAIGSKLFYVRIDKNGRGNMGYTYSVVNEEIQP